MLSLAKFIDTYTIDEYEGFVVIDGVVYVNNEVKAKLDGFKDLVVDEEPPYDPETEMLKPYYEDGNVITKKWMIEPKGEDYNGDRFFDLIFGEVTNDGENSN